MITEEQLRKALRSAGDELVAPAGGAEAIVAATRTAAMDSAPVGSLRREAIRRHLPEFAVAAGILAVAGIAIGVVTGTSHPAQNHDATRAIPTTDLGRAVGAAGSNGSSPSAGTAFKAAAGVPASVGDAIAPSSSAASASPAGSQSIQGLSGGAANGSKSSGVPAKVASSGQLTLSIGRSALNRDVSALRSLAASDGGYVSSTNLTEATKSGRGSLSLSVPASSFTAVVGRAEALGTVRNLVTKATDVTGQYNDTAARLQALGTVRAQLETLLSKAAKVSDLLSVESEIENVQTQIDELQGQQRGLDQEVTYATLTVNLQVRTAPHHPAPKPSALSRAWSDAISGFTGGLRWLLSISGALLFSLLLAGGLGLLLRVIIRRLLPLIRRRFL